MTWFFKRKTFKNPILPQGADPHVTYYNGQYILIKSEEKDSRSRIVVRRAKNLTSLAAAPIETIWSVPQGRIMHNIWAPELHLLNDKWYIYFAADDGNNENHRIFVLESLDKDLLGPYIEKGKLVAQTDKWAVDGTIFQFNNALYCVWSGWPGNENNQQNLYIAKMSNPWTLESDRMLLSEPTLGWEIPETGPAINAAPIVLLIGLKIYIVYVGNGTWTDDCCMGMLTYKGGEVLARDNWMKSVQPVFQKSPAAGIFGPVIGSFVKSKDLSEEWMVFHANVVAGSGWEGRSIWIQRFTWNSSNIPIFGTPLAPGIPRNVPSGE